MVNSVLFQSGASLVKLGISCMGSQSVWARVWLLCNGRHCAWFISGVAIVLQKVFVGRGVILPFLGCWRSLQYYSLRVLSLRQMPCQGFSLNPSHVLSILVLVNWLVSIFWVLLLWLGSGYMVGGLKPAVWHYLWSVVNLLNF